jgi:hypothetical protein
MKDRIPPSQRPERRRVDPGIIVGAASSFPSKPVLLTAPTVEDLVPYGPDMIKTLVRGYEQGLTEPCVLVIWRGGRYAREHGLDRSELPLIFQPIPGTEFEQVTGLPPYRGSSARESLPQFMFALAGADDVQGHLSLDLTPAGALLAWRYNPQFRRHLTTDKTIPDEAIRNLEQLTGVKRDA